MPIRAERHKETFVHIGKEKHQAVSKFRTVGNQSYCCGFMGASRQEAIIFGTPIIVKRLS